MRLFDVRDLGRLLACAALAMAAGCGTEPPETVPPEAPPDDAPAGLRSDIEALKRAVGDSPTDAGSIAARARVLADWVDAHALAGRPGSPFAPDVRRYATVPPTGEAAVRAAARVDALVREYQLRDEEPEALGSLAADTGPFVAGSLATITQTWTAGSRGIARGGGIWVARHFNTVYGAFQTDNPAGEDYVTVATSDADVVFEADTIMASGPHGGFRTPEPAVAFRVSEGALDPGETVTVTYGDTSGGGPGLRVTTVSGEHVPMPLYVDIDGTGDWFMLPLQPFEIVGAKATGVHGFAPSVVAAGEPFEVSVRAEDDWYNRATGDIPGFEVWVDGAVAATTEAGGEPIQMVELTIEEVGPHWIDLRSMDGTLVGEANPVLVEEAPERRIYWGDTHGHSGYAEGIGTVDYFMRFARDDARLDFVTHSEHDTALDEAEWRLMRDTVSQYDAPGRFIPYLGYEWTVRAWAGGGHHNVLFRTTAGRERVSALEYPTLSSLYQGLREKHDPADVVVIPHAHNPGDARNSDPVLEPLIEVMSMHGTFEWFMRNYLGNGHQVGFVAASDDHLSHPGYAAPSRNSLAQRGGLGAVLAPERTRDAIFDGMKARRTYATTGDRIILDVTLNGAGMGERTAFATERTLRGRAIGTAPIDTVTVFKNDEPIWTRDHLTATGAAADDAGTLHLSFHSDATPLHWGDPPRGWRHWEGTLTLLGGTVTDARLTDEANPNWQYLERDGNEVRFHTITRGDASTIVLTVT
ncbi:MAG: DUF3604 domain-containing protein, partial [Gammaproteobacteria bacterium]|nr:DUF3604 domain-containing protein [Gammaproteobacteria bacterium]